MVHIIPRGFVLLLTNLFSLFFRYFQCEPNFGLFAPLTKVAKSSLPLPPRLQAQLPQGNDVQNSLGALGSNSSINSVSSTLSEASSTPKLSALNTSQVTVRIPFDIAVESMVGRLKG